MRLVPFVVKELLAHRATRFTDRRRVLPPNSPTRGSANNAGHGRRLRAGWGPPFGVTRRQPVVTPAPDMRAR